jgi:L-fuconate dehydratase
MTIARIEAEDRRFDLEDGAGTDAVHQVTQYAFAVTRLVSDRGLTGVGIVLTLGHGNELVCRAIQMLSALLPRLPIEELMAQFGVVSRRLADDPALRWLGPHKGVVHLALASLTNACFDLWAKSRGLPLWRLLLDLEPDEIVNLLDLRYLENTLTSQRVRDLLVQQSASRPLRETVLKAGYPGYDTSVGWFQYDEQRLRENAKRALGEGFRALKLKVGSIDPKRDIQRARLLRELAGNECKVMLDANQQWSLPQAEYVCQSLRDADLYWVEEPTHPDDVEGHAELARRISPIAIALGEHVPNKVLFKNFMERQAMQFVQVDCTRVAGVAEFLTVSLLARHHGLPVVPHVGDMGQIHQHLVLFNHVALGHEALFLEYIPHLREHLVHPARVEGGRYITPEEPGLSCDLK